MCYQSFMMHLCSDGHEFCFVFFLFQDIPRLSSRFYILTKPCIYSMTECIRPQFEESSCKIMVTSLNITLIIRSSVTSWSAKINARLWTLQHRIFVENMGQFRVWTFNINGRHKHACDHNMNTWRNFPQLSMFSIQNHTEVPYVWGVLCKLAFMCAKFFSQVTNGAFPPYSSGTLLDSTLRVFVLGWELGTVLVTAPSRL